MILYSAGSLFESDAEALVNTVNTVGVMGKGIAKEFKARYPENFRIYADACRTGTLQTGRLISFREGEKLIVNFPTKKHWRDPSKYEYITSGLLALESLILDLPIKSIAIPALGCGNGGLDWGTVSEMIEHHLSDLPCRIEVYLPKKDK